MLKEESYYDKLSHAAEDKPVGMKFDGDKAYMSLVPPLAELELAKVLTFGAQKYARDNWRKVDDWQFRYLNAALRHINAYKQGEKQDPESGFHHLAHATACLMFITELELERGKEKDD